MRADRVKEERNENRHETQVVLRCKIVVIGMRWNDSGIGDSLALTSDFSMETLAR